MIAGRVATWKSGTRAVSPAGLGTTAMAAGTAPGAGVGEARRWFSGGDHVFFAEQPIGNTLPPASAPREFDHDWALGRQAGAKFRAGKR